MGNPREHYTRTDECSRVNPPIQVTLDMLDHGPACTIEGVCCEYRTPDLGCGHESNTHEGSCQYRAPSLSLV